MTSCCYIVSANATNDLLKNKIDYHITSDCCICFSFRTIHGMKLHLQTCMDTLESSRKTVMDKLLEINKTMKKPRVEDIECIGNCKYCNKKDDGPTCIHCELDERFQVCFFCLCVCARFYMKFLLMLVNVLKKSSQEYEARLFRLNKSRGGVMEHASAEEMVDLQKKKSARNHFFFGLSSRNNDVNPSHVDNEEPTKRNASDAVIVSHLICF